MNETAKLTFKDKTIELPVTEGTFGEKGLDISKLRASTGLITFDPGYVNTGSCNSSITYLNGEEGVLLYRGIPIEQLAEKSSFLETAYLLIYGKLPNQDENKYFTESIINHSMIHESVKDFYSGVPATAHPMAVCSAVIGALATFYPDAMDPRNERHVEISIHRLIAKLPTIAAYSYKKSIGQPFIYPDDSLDYCSNYLRMMFSVPCAEYHVDPVIAKALDVLFILHADHEQNCSTSTVRLVGSSMANLFASISAGISALWGPLHGGANQAVIEMLQEIHEGGGNVNKYIDKAKDKNDPFRLMGFGHRVYKNFDPRSRILKKYCHEVLDKMGVDEAYLEIAMKLEEIALKDDYFISKKLYPNVDFYSGIIYKAMKIPLNMFTVLFAIGRLPGWIAQWAEMHRDKNFKIGRPRQIFTGATKTDYVPITERK
ncbi:MAG: citrate synthase [Nitrospinota bacterium]|nr:citrate synthase [Nitrospinota bacterium]